MSLQSINCVRLRYLFSFSFYVALFSFQNALASSSPELKQCVAQAPVVASQNEVNEVLVQKSLSLSRRENLQPEQIYALKLYTRLSGSSTSVQNPKIKKMAKYASQNKFLEAAKVVIEDDLFYNVRLRNFVAPFSSKDFSTSEPMNDLQALMMGVIRDDIDARLILTGNFRYEGAQQLSLAKVSLDNNNHYQQMENANVNYRQSLVRTSQQWDEDATIGVGAFTTRAWAKINYDAGTNRRTIKNAMEVFLCTPIESWKTRAVPDVFVWRDVDRIPAGNPANYQNTCRNCHAIMDGMAGAISKMNYVNSAFAPSKQILPKVNQNQKTYADGYVVIDDSWINMLNHNKTIDFGWRSEMEGKGLQSWARMLASSKAYSRCLVQKVIKEVCEKSFDAKQEEEMVNTFEKNGWNLKTLFTDVAVHSACIAGH